MTVHGPGRWKTLTRRSKRIALIVAGVIVFLIGLVMSIPGVPGPGILVVFWGLCLMGAEGIFIAVVTWCFSLVGLSWLGVKIVHWLHKASFKTPPPPAEKK